MSKYSIIAPQTKHKLQRHFGKTYDYIKENASVLDVGCSSGYYARLLIDEKSCTVDGIEIDAEDRVEAEKYLRAVYDVDLDSVKWPNELTSKKYDVIFIGDVIEHVKDATKILSRLRKMLNIGGVIIISTPNIAHLTIRLELLDGNFEYEKTGILDETHLKYFTLRSLTSLVNGAGFKIQEIDYSLNDLHPDTVSHQLNLVGLKPTKKFWKKIQEPEARAYQWKIVLIVDDGVASKNQNISPPVKPMQNNYWFVGQVKEFAKKNEALSERLKVSEKKLATIENELSIVKSSFGWRIQNKIKKIIG